MGDNCRKLRVITVENLVTSYNCCTTRYTLTEMFQFMMFSHSLFILHTLFNSNKQLPEFAKRLLMWHRKYKLESKWDGTIDLDINAKIQFEKLLVKLKLVHIIWTYLNIWKKKVFKTCWFLQKMYCLFCYSWHIYSILQYHCFLENILCTHI